MDYQIFTPCPTLEPLVKCYWILESDESERPSRQRIVPDGCQELIFHYGDLYRQYFNDCESVIQPRCFVIGQLTKPLEIEGLGKTGIFAVRFWPDGLNHFLSVDPALLADTAMPISDVWGDTASDLANAVLNAANTAERIEHVEQFLISRLSNQSLVDHVLRSSLDNLYRQAGQCAIAEIAESLDVSAKHLERKFKTKIGLTPKKLARLIRFQTTLRHLTQNPEQSLTALAMHGQYFDQSHFVKDFREFTGMTPKQFFGDQLQWSQLFCQS